MIHTDPIQRRELGEITRQKILDTAERLFAEQGFEVTSLRQITQVARVNLAAINYHFRSKDALIEAVISRRMEPINRTRLALLQEALDRAVPGSPPVEEVVRAFIYPVLEFRKSNPELGRLVGLLVGRSHVDSARAARECFLAHARQVVEPFVKAFHLALPGLPLNELMWRLHFTAGVLAHTLIGMDHIRVLAPQNCDLEDPDALAERMVQFVCAGLRAPMVAPPAEGRQ